MYIYDHLYTCSISYTFKSVLNTFTLYTTKKSRGCFFRDRKVRADYAYHHGMYLNTEDLRPLEEDGFDVVRPDGVKQKCVMVVGKVIVDWKEARLAIGQMASAQAAWPHLHLFVPNADMGLPKLRERYSERTDVDHFGMITSSRSGYVCTYTFISVYTVYVRVQAYTFKSVYIFIYVYTLTYILIANDNE